MTDLQRSRWIVATLGTLVVLAAGSRAAVSAPPEDSRPASQPAAADGTGCMAACTLGGPVVANPARLALGEAALVSIQASLTCGAAPALVDGPADIVLLVDYSYSMVYPSGDLTEAKRLANQLIGRLRPDL